MPRFRVTPIERATEQALVAVALAVRPETSPTWTDVAAAKGATGGARGHARAARAAGDGLMPRATAARPQSADAELLDDALHSLEQTLLFIGEDQEPTNAKLGVAVGALLTLLGIGIAGAI